MGAALETSNVCGNGRYDAERPAMLHKPTKEPGHSGLEGRRPDSMQSDQQLLSLSPCNHLNFSPGEMTSMHRIRSGLLGLVTGLGDRTSCCP